MFMFCIVQLFGVFSIDGLMDFALGFVLFIAVGNFLWNLSTHQNYEDESNKSQKNQHKHRDLYGKPKRKKPRRGREIPL